MKYLNSSFSIEPAKKLDGLACPRCALGPKWGEHALDCGSHPIEIVMPDGELRAFAHMSPEVLDAQFEGGKMTARTRSAVEARTRYLCNKLGVPVPCFDA